jgi:hypothetical protein
MYLASESLSGSQREENIMHFPLSGLLPQNQCLAVVRDAGLLLVLEGEGNTPRVIRAQRISPGELSIAIPIIQAYPFHGLYQVILAAFYGPVTDETVSKYEEILSDAIQDGLWDEAMRPARNLLSRTRLKFRALGFDVKSVLETGYMLSLYKPAKRKSS